MKFYYIVHATQGDNVSDIEATNEKDALSKVGDIYAPKDPITGQSHTNVSFEIISKAQHDSEKTRIEKTRKEEAEFVTREDLTDEE